MKLTDAQYARIAPCLPVQRGHVRLSNLQALNAILYVAEQGVQVAGLAAAGRQLASLLPAPPRAALSDNGAAFQGHFHVRLEARGLPHW